MSRFAVSSRLVIALGLSLAGLGCSDLTSPNAITIQKEPLAPQNGPNAPGQNAPAGDTKPAAAPGGVAPGAVAPAKLEPARPAAPMVQPIPAGGSCG